MIRSWVLLIGVLTTGTCTLQDLDVEETCNLLPQQGRGIPHEMACLQATRQRVLPALEGFAQKDVLHQPNRSDPSSTDGATALTERPAAKADLNERVAPAKSQLSRIARGNIKRSIRQGVEKMDTAKPCLTPDIAVCDPPEIQILEKIREPNEGIDDTWAKSILHEITGQDGVIMLSLARDPMRFMSSSKHLKSISVKPLRLAATDGHCASRSTLNKGCGLDDDPDFWCYNNTAGAGGCASRAEQAICDSHRRALEIALKRWYEWTLILEDDAIPLIPKGVDWDASMRTAWGKRPADARIIRLTWCRFDDDPDFFPDDEIVEAGDFRFIRGRSENVGGCPIATLYHKSVIPHFLKIFPCCMAVDACIMWDFYMHPQNATADNPHALRWVDRVLWNLEVNNSTQWIQAHHKGILYGRHFGVMMPSGKTSTRDGEP